MARLYADEDFSYPGVEELRLLGPDVITAQEAGLGQKRTPDSAILTDACADLRAVLTFNRRHYFRLHRQRPQHSGIVACTQDNDVIALAARISQEISNHPSLDGLLIRVYRPNPKKSP